MNEIMKDVNFDNYKFKLLENATKINVSDIPKDVVKLHKQCKNVYVKTINGKKYFIYHTPNKSSFYIFNDDKIVCIDNKDIAYGVRDKFFSTDTAVNLSYCHIYNMPYTYIMHNENGPAFKDTYGSLSYYINGKQISAKKFAEQEKQSNNLDIFNNIDDIRFLDVELLNDCNIFNIKLNKTIKEGSTTIYVFDKLTVYVEDKKVHRDDGPAIEYADGSKQWFKNGEIHRLDGPAIEYADGSKQWFKDGFFHRTDGPAVELADGTKEWYQDGELYREGDEAHIEYSDGCKEWYNNDDELVKKLYSDGDMCWYKKGKLHREDGPAFEHANGDKEWYIEGNLHKDNGPAVESANGDKYWFKKGKQHRKDGPAIELKSGYKEWFEEGVLIKTSLDSEEKSLFPIIGIIGAAAMIGKTMTNMSEAEKVVIHKKAISK